MLPAFIISTFQTNSAWRSRDGPGRSLLLLKAVATKRCCESSWGMPKAYNSIREGASFGVLQILEVMGLRLDTEASLKSSPIF